MPGSCSITAGSWPAHPPPLLAGWRLRSKGKLLEEQIEAMAPASPSRAWGQRYRRPPLSRGRAWAGRASQIALAKKRASATTGKKIAATTATR
jgi:hypothetical protein